METQLLRINRYVALQEPHAVPGAGPITLTGCGWDSGTEGWGGCRGREVRHGSYARSGATATSNAQNTTKTHNFSSSILSESKVEDPPQAFHYGGHTENKYTQPIYLFTQLRHSSSLPYVLLSLAYPSLA